MQSSFTNKSQEMKSIKVLETDVQSTIITGPLISSTEPRVIMKAGRHIKKVIYIASLAGMGLFLNSCLGGYIATEPAYVEYSRPPRPTQTHIWIDGDWAWNNQTHVYVQRAGYWERPRQNQTYVTGHWQTTSKGKSWAPGRWQKENNRGNRSRR
jgi:hypothetical protein